MSDIPEYTEAGIEVLDIFFQGYVSAIFFFEDQHHEAVYERVLKRLLPKLSSFQVICLGGKSKLIAKAKEQHPQDIKWLFVLDKDFDDLVGTVFVQDDVYYLRAFSFDNYLIDLSALICICVEIKPRELTEREARQRCAEFESFWSLLCTRLEQISRLFAVARRHRVPIKTTKMTIEELLDGADSALPIPTDEWYQSYLERFRKTINGKSEWLAEEQALTFELQHAFDKNPKVDFPDVSVIDQLPGKMLLGCVIRAMESWLEVRLSDIDVVELYARLAGHADLSRLAYLAEMISKDHPDLIAA